MRDDINLVRIRSFYVRTLPKGSTENQLLKIRKTCEKIRTFGARFSLSSGKIRCPDMMKRVRKEPLKHNSSISENREYLECIIDRSRVYRLTVRPLDSFT